MAGCVNTGINMQLCSYLRIKIAANRFNVISSNASNINLVNTVSDLADKAGIAPNVSVHVISNDTIDQPSQDHSRAGYYDAPRTAIHLRNIKLNGADDKNNVISSADLLHEYGHAIDLTGDIKGIRGVADRISRPVAYNLFHPAYEQAADNNARRLISQINDKDSRNELFRIYDRLSAGNQYAAKVLAPAEIGAGVGSIAGLGIGGALGGYIGYTGANNIYKYFNKDTAKKGYKPTLTHNLVNVTGALLGGAGGGIVGNRIGRQIGYYAGLPFISNKKINQVNRILAKTSEDTAYGRSLIQGANDILSKEGRE